ncbi:MAG: hypothetical protein EA392_00925 [Cryomorphaceae bacterium]|nr:MAG: hypothetical protein EA392_00925 [Cryomorphaceae bacterium]
MARTARRLAKTDSDIHKGLIRIVETTAQAIHGESLRNAPKGETAGLRTGYQIDERRLKRDLQASVFNDTFYTPYQEFGTGSLVSVPPGFEAMAMQFKGAGIKEVNITPQPHFAPAIERNEPRHIKAIEKLIDKHTDR